jgi:hypothetical protein
MTMRDTIATSIHPVLHVHTSLVIYAPVTNNPRIATGNARSVFPAKLLQGRASACVDAERNRNSERPRMAAAPNPTNRASK